MAVLTRAQKSALLWLRNRGGAGVFTRSQVLLAAGEYAPVMRATWNILTALELTEVYEKNRLRLTTAGRKEPLDDVGESTGSGCA